MAARVASAIETTGSERATIERGTPASELMRRAGEGAASVIAHRYGQSAVRRVTIFTGPGNNGGDGWVVAESLTRRGFASHVVEIAEPKSEESRDARERAIAAGAIPASENESPPLIVDALLGTGGSGSPRGAIASAIADIRQRRETGATVVSLDLPSGLDATTGEFTDAITADLTISFGMMKRGHLIARDTCGTIVVVDIGLEADECLPLLVDAHWVRERIPRIPSSAHKGTRKRLALVGGGPGMAGAAILAGEGALRSGIGLLRISTAPRNEVATHAGIPAATVQPWPENANELARLCEDADALAVGPGMGRTTKTRDLVERLLIAWTGPVVIDADAISVFAGDALSLAQLLRGRPAVITPHPAELGRLLGVDTSAVLDERFDIGLDLARQIGAAVLLKGSPTVVFSPTGDRFVSAAGTPALATGGSGDILTGMTATLLAQMCDPDENRTAAEAAACAAFVHGRAAELCGAVRGTTLDDVLHKLPDAWNEKLHDIPAGLLAELEYIS